MTQEERLFFDRRLVAGFDKAVTEPEDDVVALNFSYRGLTLLAGVASCLVLVACVGALLAL